MKETKPTLLIRKNKDLPCKIEKQTKNKKNKSTNKKLLVKPKTQTQELRRKYKPVCKTKKAITYRPKKDIDYPAYMESFFEYWISKTALRQFRAANTKIFKTAIANIRNLLNGSLFEDITSIPDCQKKPYEFEDFVKSLNNFHNAVVNLDVKPYDKSYIKNLSLGEFLYDIRIGTSHFLQYLLEEPKNITLTRELNLPLTNALKQLYVNKILNGVNGNMTKLDYNCFVSAGNQLHKFLVANKDRIHEITISSVQQQADLLWECIISHSDITKITPFYFSSSITFSNLEKYMTEAGYFKSVDPKNDPLGGLDMSLPIEFQNRRN
jgi:hypothetical protein